MSPRPIVSLIWQGPIGVGNLPGLEGQKDLVGPHIYVICQHYANHTTVYVGQSKTFLNRLWQHYLNFLGLHYLIRDEDGEHVYDPRNDDMFEKLNNLKEFFSFIVNDVSRTRIFYAKCAPKALDPVESTLIDHAFTNFPYESNDKKYRCDNTRRQNYGDDDTPITIDMKYERLEDNGKVVLKEIFGEQVKCKFDA